MRRTLLFTFAAALISSALSQNPVVTARMVVTVEPHHGAPSPTVSPADVMVYHNKDRFPVTALTPLRSAGLQLWILIDDGADTDLGSQLGDLRKFILAQPANFEVGVGYMRNGTVTSTQGPTTSHDLAAKALRLPLGDAGASTSPYISLVDLIKKWPPTDRAREVLMISSGIDPLYGPGPQNPYMQRAIDEAQRAGVVVSSIFFGGVGHSGHSYWQITWGQNNLSQLTEETGGEFYWQGMSNPVSFSPYLDEFSRVLSNQYLVTFVAGGKPGSFEPIKARTEIPHVSVVAPSKVYIPPKG